MGFANRLFFTASLVGLWAGSASLSHASPRPLLTAHMPAEADHAHFVAPLSAGTMMHLAITLPIHHEALLDGLLRDLQDPRSPSYRHYLSVAEFTSRFGPTASEYETLESFAVSHGLTVSARAPNRFVLDVQADAATVARAFGVHMGTYRHANGAEFFAPDREPVMDIGIPVLHVSGLDNAVMPAPRSVPPAGAKANAQAKVIAQATGSGPNGNFKASDMRAAYYGTGPLTGAGQIVGLMEFEGYNIADIQSYFSEMGQTLNVPIVGISVDGVSVTCTGTCENYEASIDIEQTIGMAPGLQQVSFYVGSTAIDILNKIATDNTAKQISSSYGWPAEAPVEDPVYKEFAAQGQSFVDATGDMGYKLGPGGVWPADDANVTAIGGTILTTQSPGGGWLAEVGWPLGGGGPSPDGIKIPLWQKPFINANNKGALVRRNVPDVSMDANYDSWACYDQKCNGANGGTSFSAPRWAGFIALVNQQSMATKKTTVGFLNPTLYKIAGTNSYTTDFHDITSGFNGKYFAVPGYDDVTGLGTPQTALVNALVGP